VQPRVDSGVARDRVAPVPPVAVGAVPALHRLAGFESDEVLCPADGGVKVPFDHTLITRRRVGMRGLSPINNYLLFLLTACEPLTIGQTWQLRD
jgi:hypothetical protein